MRQVTQKGQLEIAEHEGIVLGPYKDSKGVWTYGIGHTSAAGGLKPEKMQRENTREWPRERALEEITGTIIPLFDADLAKYEERVNEAIRVPLEPHQFDALTSFDFNTGGIFIARLTRDINRGDFASAARNFMGWVKPPELRKRRTAEMNLFKTGNYDANGDAITVWDATPDGRIWYRDTFSGTELLKLMGARQEPPFWQRFWGRLRGLWG